MQSVGEYYLFSSEPKSMPQVTNENRDLDVTPSVSCVEVQTFRLRVVPTVVKHNTPDLENHWGKYPYLKFFPSL